MNPSYFSWWLGKQPPSSLTRKDVEELSLVDITTKLDPKDLLAVMFYGNDRAVGAAVNALKERFEWELHVIEELNYPREEA